MLGLLESFKKNHTIDIEKFLSMRAQSTEEGIWKEIHMFGKENSCMAASSTVPWTCATGVGCYRQFNAVPEPWVPLDFGRLNA